jgi:hypothetical protein
VWSVIAAACFPSFVSYRMERCARAQAQLREGDLLVIVSLYVATCSPENWDHTTHAHSTSAVAVQGEERERDEQ